MYLLWRAFDHGTRTVTSARLPVPGTARGSVRRQEVTMSRRDRLVWAGGVAVAAGGVRRCLGVRRVVGGHLAVGYVGGRYGWAWLVRRHVRCGRRAARVAKIVRHAAPPRSTGRNLGDHNWGELA